MTDANFSGETTSGDIEFVQAENLTNIDAAQLAGSGLDLTSGTIDSSGATLGAGVQPLIMQPTFLEGMGAACHMRQSGDVPVACITDITDNILFRNYEANLPDGTLHTKWVIRKLRTQVTRFWQASTAYVVLTTGNTDLEKGYSPLPTLGFNARYPEGIQTLELNDEVCIYLGYLPTLRPVTQDDIKENRLLRVFVGVAETISSTGTSNMGATITIQLRDRMKYLMDSLTSYNSIEDLDLAAGVTEGSEEKVKRSKTIISLGRRAMGHITGVNGEGGDICPGPVCGKTIDEGIIHDIEEAASGDAAVAESFSPDVLYGNNTTYKAKVKLEYSSKTIKELQKKREQLQKDQATANSGAVTVAPNTTSSLREDILRDKQGTGEESDAGFLNNIANLRPGVQAQGFTREIEVEINSGDPDISQEDLTARALAKARDTDKFADDATISSVPAEGESSSDRSLRALTENVSLPTEMPKFHIVVGRRAYEQSDWGNSFQMVERRPLEYIKTIAAQEVYPTEVFQDHRSGDYYFTPRANDPTGLEDEAKFERTYFWRSYPSKVRPDICQMLLMWKDERSTIGFRSNIVVTSIQGFKSDSQGITVHLKVIPKWLKGKKFACTYYTISDPSIRSADDAAVLAHKYARVNSKEVRGGQCRVIGDPSLTPGEVIQVYGSPSHQLLDSNNNLDKDAYDKERSLFTDYNKAYNDTYGAFTNAVKDSENEDESSIDIQEVNGEPMAVNMKNITGKEHGAAMCNLGGEIPEQASATDDTNTSALTYPEEPRSMFRIQAVMHKFNDGQAGYLSEMYVISPF